MIYSKTEIETGDMEVTVFKKRPFRFFRSSVVVSPTKVSSTIMIETTEDVDEIIFNGKKIKLNV